RLFDARTGEPAGKLPGQVGRVTAIAFDPAATRLAVASGEPGQSGVVRVYRRGKDGRPDPASTITLAPHKHAAYTLAFAPDGRRLAAAGVDKSIRIWAVEKGEPRLVQSVFAHQGPVWRLGYTADGRTLYSAGEDRAIKAWDTAKLVESKVFPAQPEAMLGFA